MVQSYAKQKKIKQKRQKVGLIILILLLLAGGSVAWWTIHRKSNSKTPATQPSSQTSKNSSDQSKIDYSPPTNTDKQSVDQTKQDIVKQQSTNPNSADTGKKKVTPIITSAYYAGDQVKSYASIEGIIEDGGSCTFTFSKGNDSVVKLSAGVADASTTRCTPLSFAKSELGSGTWNVTLTYSSSSSVGTSSSLEVQ